jgi:hypothetical protein
VSNPFEDDYPQFFQAVAYYGDPRDIRRIREAHSEWSKPRERPLYTKHGWDTPVVGEACRALISDLENGVVRAWCRLGKNEPYELINPVEWRELRERAPPLANILRVLAQAPRRAAGAYPLVSIPVIKIGPSKGTGARLLFSVAGEIGPVPERDAFIFVVAHEDYLLSVVVSRDDVLKARPAPPPPEHDELVAAYKNAPAAGAENREQQDAFVEEIYGKLPKKAREAARSVADIAGKPGPKRRRS